MNPEHHPSLGAVNRFVEKRHARRFRVAQAKAQRMRDDDRWMHDLASLRTPGEGTGI